MHGLGCGAAARRVQEIEAARLILDPEQAAALDGFFQGCIQICPAQPAHEIGILGELSAAQEVRPAFHVCDAPQGIQRDLQLGQIVYFVQQLAEERVGHLGEGFGGGKAVEIRHLAVLQAVSVHGVIWSPSGVQ